MFGNRNGVDVHMGLPFGHFSLTSNTIDTKKRRPRRILLEIYGWTLSRNHEAGADLLGFVRF